MSPTLPFLLAALLVLYNSLSNLVPQGLHDQIYVPLNLGVVTLVVVLARRLGYSWASLGLLPQRLSRTLRWGLGVGVLLPAPLFLMLALPESLTSLIELRPHQGTQGGSILAYQALVRIPLGTALTEEILFRGVLYGMWNAVSRVPVAVVGSSAAFGLWHIVPALELLHENEQFASSPLLAGGVVGGVVAAFVGGLLLCWLRIRCGSIYASTLAHWLINTLSLLAIFLAQS